MFEENKFKLSKNENNKKTEGTLKSSKGMQIFCINAPTEEITETLLKDLEGFIPIADSIIKDYLEE